MEHNHCHQATVGQTNESSHACGTLFDCSTIRDWHLDPSMNRKFVPAVTDRRQGENVGGIDTDGIATTRVNETAG